MADSFKLNLGQYPPEYNRALHGPYDPARYYGKPDTPFGDVKIGELAAWVGRRQKSPSSAIALMSRAWWRWQHAYTLPKRCGIAPFIQLTVTGMAIFYYLNYDRIKHHKHWKYH